MLIDWFTVGAQIINFLILLVLLKIFLFDRIVRAIDEREAKINARFEEADRTEEEARHKAQALAQEKRGLEEKRAELMETARKEAEDQRRQWAAKARQEIEDQRIRWQKALADQKEAFSRDLRHLAAGQVCAVSRRALKDLADENLEERIIEGFLGRIAAMDDAAKKKFNRLQSRQNNAAAVRSAFEVSTRMRQKITRALHQALSEDLEIDYATDPDLLAGIELKADGQKVGWSLKDYLQTLEENVINAIEAQVDADEKAGRDDEPKQSNSAEQGDLGKNEQRSD